MKAVMKAAHGWDSATFDVKNAFLGAPGDKTKLLLIKTPPEFRKHFRAKYLQVAKTAYGLNSSPKLFKDHLNTVL